MTAAGPDPLALLGQQWGVPVNDYRARPDAEFEQWLAGVEARPAVDPDDDAREDAQRGHYERLNPLVALSVFAVVVFVVAVVFFAWRDHRAIERCEAMGGQTWDSGVHCVLGDGEVVNTRGGVWGQ